MSNAAGTAQLPTLTAGQRQAMIHIIGACFPYRRSWDLQLEDYARSVNLYSRMMAGKYDGADWLGRVLKYAIHRMQLR